MNNTLYILSIYSHMYNVVECLWNELAPVVTYVMAAIKIVVPSPASLFCHSLEVIKTTKHKL